MQVQPFLSRFAGPMEQTSMPVMRCNPMTQTSEALREGVWVRGLEHPSLGVGSRGTKTGVKTESTDYC
jgi:hypothetical protein